MCKGKVAVTALALVAGCNWNGLDAYAETAPIRVHKAPAGYRGTRYGEVLASLRAGPGVADAARFAASAGAGSSLVLGGVLRDGEPHESASLRCKNAECGDGFDLGETLIPFATWGAGEQPPRTGCVFVPGNGTAPATQAVVVCESQDVPQRFDLRLDAVRGSDAKLAYSGFGLPTGHPLGVVLFGAHSVQLRGGERHRGALYAQPDLARAGAEPIAPFARRVALVDAAGMTFDPAADAGDLGRQVVGAQSATGELLVAITQPSRQRALVASYDPSVPDALRVRACIETPDRSLRGFGERAALGDVDGDGLPELFVGSDPIAGAEPGRQALYVYAGRGLPSRGGAAVAGDATGLRTATAASSEVARGCPAWSAAPVPVTCRDAQGFACASSGFGAALATGDVNGDGRADLIVGAPATRVAGVDQAGAAWLVPGSAAGLDQASMRPIAPSPRARAQFGMAVTAVRSGARDEPVVGSPGAARVYVFMCGPLEEGFPADSACLPK